MFTFSKYERLRSRQLINETLNKGEIIFVHPFKLYYLISKNNENKSSVQFTVSVPKRIFKRAVDRNRIKRLIKESFRLNKSDFQKSESFNSIDISLFLIYIDKNILNFETANSKIRLLLQKLTQTVTRS